MIFEFKFVLDQSDFGNEETLTFFPRSIDRLNTFFPRSVKKKLPVNYLIPIYYIITIITK